jgi:hypothetical protein
MIPNLKKIYGLFSSWPQNDEPLLLLRSLSSVISEEEFCAISLLVSEFGVLPNDFSIELKVFLYKHTKLGIWWQLNMGHLLFFAVLDGDR